jgi:hypothetical protein
MFTTDVSRPQPDKILRVTTSNWKHVSDYMQSHTIHDMHRDFAGLDADDKRLHVYIQRLMYSRKYLESSWNESHSGPEFDKMFPFGFSALKFDTATAPEACVWRGREWIRFKLETDKYKRTSKLNDPSSNDPIDKMNQQWENASEFVQSGVIDAVDEDDEGEWVSTRQLQGMYKKHTGKTIGIEFLNMVVTEAFHFEFRKGLVYVYCVRL